MDFKARLKAARKARGLTQAAMAESLGISQGAVTGWEVGRREPEYSMLLKVAALLDVSIGYLLGHEGGGVPPPDVAVVIGELAGAVDAGAATVDGDALTPEAAGVAATMLMGTLDATRAAQRREALKTPSAQKSTGEDESHGR